MSNHNGRALRKGQESRMVKWVGREKSDKQHTFRTKQDIEHVQPFDWFRFSSDKDVYAKLLTRILNVIRKKEKEKIIEFDKQEAPKWTIAYGCRQTRILIMKSVQLSGRKAVPVWMQHTKKTSFRESKGVRRFPVSSLHTWQCVVKQKTNNRALNAKKAL